MMCGVVNTSYRKEEPNAFAMELTNTFLHEDTKDGRPRRWVYHRKCGKKGYLTDEHVMKVMVCIVITCGTELQRAKRTNL